MTPDEALKLVNRMAATLEDVPDGGKVIHWPTDDALLVWDALDELSQLVRSLVRTHGFFLAQRLPEEYEHPKIGLVHTEIGSTVQWDGNAVLTALSDNYLAVDVTTGEISGQPVLAVPTDILRKAVPACGPNQTSSKWNKGGLKAAGLNTGMYSRTEYGQKTLRRGPRYRKGDARTPESTVEAAAPVPPVSER